MCWHLAVTATCCQHLGNFLSHGNMQMKYLEIKVTDNAGLLACFKKECRTVSCLVWHTIKITSPWSRTRLFLFARRILLTSVPRLATSSLTSTHSYELYTSWSNRTWLSTSRISRQKRRSWPFSLVITTFTLSAPQLRSSNKRSMPRRVMTFARMTNYSHQALPCLWSHN